MDDQAYKYMLVSENHIKGAGMFTSDLSSVLQKLFIISDIRLVKQKNASSYVDHQEMKKAKVRKDKIRPVKDIYIYIYIYISNLHLRERKADLYIYREREREKEIGSGESDDGDVDAKSRWRDRGRGIQLRNIAICSSFTSAFSAHSGFGSAANI